MTSATALRLPGDGPYVVTGADDGGALAAAGFAVQRVGALHLFSRRAEGLAQSGRAPVCGGGDWLTASTGSLGDPPLYTGALDVAAGRWVVSNDRFAAAAVLRAWSAADGAALEPLAALGCVQPLPVATAARWHRGGSAWALDTFARPLPWAPSRPADRADAAAARVLAELQHAVAGWASRYDRPVVLLSGGVDSGLVAAFAHAVNPRTVALSLRTSWGDEVERAAATAAHIGVPLEVVDLTEDDLCAGIEETQTWLQRGEPELCLVQLMISEARRIAGGFADALLTGMGSDLLNAPNDVGMSTGQEPNRDGDELGALVQRVRGAAGTGLFFSGRWHPRAAGGLPIAHPFWTEPAVHAQLSVPFEAKQGDGYEKRYLRALAERFLPHETAWGHKYAIHEGSGLQENLGRALARRDPALGGDPLTALWTRTAHRRVAGGALEPTR